MGIVLKFKPPSEYQEAKIFMQWCRLQPVVCDLILHIPNEEKCINQRRIKKEAGQRNGVSDYFLPLPTEKFHGLWLELKRSKPGSSNVSADQQNWIDLMRRYGYDAHVAYGAEMAVQIVRDYLS